MTSPNVKSKAKLEIIGDDDIKCDIDFANGTGFSLRRTRSYVRYIWKDGKWGNGSLIRGEPIISMHIAGILVSR